MIDSIFARQGTWNRGLPGSQRALTRPQLDLLLRLIGEDEESGAVDRRGAGETVWKPSGWHKYIIREDARGNRHTLERLSNLQESAAGRLF